MRRSGGWALILIGGIALVGCTPAAAAPRAVSAEPSAPSGDPRRDPTETYSPDDVKVP
ncbi:hypothetical protein ACFV3I_04300 [Microbacterium sp. NPDC059771]|uniref:hypothetical protein n=1 Tax=Microbacterium sp. NPDC059771 TaxID=3346941 RepID=UPI003648235F